MELICVVCPIGCRLQVEISGCLPPSVSGNLCPRGPAYAGEEAIRPRRILASTVRLRGSKIGALPVKSDRPVPRDMLAACVQALAGVVMSAPVRMGDLALADVLGSGANVIAARSIPGNAPGGETTWPNT